jgi:nucleoside-diphosphate-sugar epimerase
MAQMNILITGGNGYIAKSLNKGLWKGSDRPNITYITRKDFDLIDRRATNNYFKDKYFDVVIHTAIVGGNRLKEDDSKVFYQNLSMFYNLLANQDKFNQLISFGSGAELGYPTDPYGLSKNIINKIIQSEPKFNNIRIFGVFDKDELDRRFITPNIKRYINKEPIIIHQNKLMDFFYMEDLITVVNHIIKNPNVKEITCSYLQPYSLYDIASLINNLGLHKCEIKIENDGMGDPYISKPQKLDLPLIGLEKAIKQIYEKLN